METLIKIPTESFKTIEIPGGEAVGKMCIAVVNIKDLPKELDNWREVNPREVNLNSGVSRQIMTTLEEHPGDFVMRNRGITIVANHAEFDNRAKVIRLEFGDREERVKIVDARNRSTEVKIVAFENLLGHFDSLKVILGTQSYADKIAYKENEMAEDGSKKEVPIEEILSYILCFDVEDFDHNSHPIKAYSGKASVVKHYRDNVEKMQKYFPLAPDILKLRDTIYEDLPLIWNAVGNDAEGGKLGKVRGVKTVKEAKVLPFSGRGTRHVIPSGFIYPTLAAFRPLVRVEGGKASWKDDPFKVYAKLREELISKVVDTAKRTKNPNEMGKNPDFWGVCYAMVEREVLVRKL